ncbi:MAG: RsmB/NOP family class I SAM-dependent RNA methyltransferase [Bacteroidetes bacterium]|nr:RsmB/NOP family class I SAM-dependent RNA methyltransferase [Rhodothermia bacterium]MCS7155750.1 RsmB/NOP family class I SAM-dependent RNA methyltransferase [Bacteroidota bacterium]MCX7906149.1 RsmB/NOP family class I SAM-dependent RNA methyltransferase [Bacteroidota bacterium]MDW8138277.1 RsmB/NOP family class I SAM-dependent RNA methyltransferase [Bacteroidota bacterium]MDW8285961.1 RsmB/NOP family class I SAM-dependent RNA methyltransferase [Bacteroidota bacterium]
MLEQKRLIRPYWVSASAQLYQQIVHSKYPADREMEAFFKAHPEFGKRDRKFIAETVYGMLRNRRWLEFAVSRWWREPEPREWVLLYLAAFEDAERLELPWTPDEAQRIQSALSWARQVAPPADPAQALGLRYSFPDWMLRIWIDRYGLEEAEALCQGLNRAAPLCVRVNTLKATREAVQERIRQEGWTTRPTPYSPVGLIFEKRISVFQTASFREGLYEVQDEGSQLISYLTEARPGMRVVDGCAGGGGKTLHLACLMENKGMLYAFDIYTIRLEQLRPRARRAGAHNIRAQRIPHNRAKVVRRLYGKIDVVLVDAPCSGTGVMRRNPDTAWKVTPEKVETLVEQQRAILHAYAPLLKPGGRMVYATCSLLPQENEEVVGAFLEEHPDFHLEPVGPILERQRIFVPLEDAFLRLYPHRHGTDGFFGAVLRYEP